MSALTVCNISVRQDTEGRYCLNDLHNVAGGVGHHQPAKYFATQGSQDLISEIGGLAVSSQRGRNGGTYACKELVYAYAMWISPKFNLQVIRAYDAMQTPAAPVTPMSSFEMMRVQLDSMIALDNKQKAQEAALQQ